MSRKSKGTNAERELVHFFYERGWMPLRVAGSGSSKYPCPDVLAGKENRRVAIEGKSSKSQYIYLTKKEVSELILFSRVFGAEAWVGARFNNEEWRFVRAEDLRETNKNFNISLESAKNEGKTFHELVGTKALNTPI